MELMMHSPAMPRRKGAESEPTTVVAIRLPASLVKRIDNELMAISPPGIQIPRSELVKRLLSEALDARAAGRVVQ